MADNKVYSNKSQRFTQLIGANNTIIGSGRRTGNTDSIAPLHSIKTWFNWQYYEAFDFLGGVDKSQTLISREINQGITKSGTEYHYLKPDFFIGFV